MTQTFRRVVTGNNAAGKSYLESDVDVAEAELGNFNFWRTAPGGAEPDLAAPVPFFPPPGESIFRIFRLPPADPATSPQQMAAIANAFFAGVGSANAKVDTSRHPLMHLTPTTDYIVLLLGEVSLLLDEGEPVPLKPFDVVVQRGTNHTWVVTGREPAVLMAVMLGTP
jgi:hypothetical protein